MGRGDDNLLFQSNPIKKRERDDHHLGQEGAFPDLLDDFILGENFSVALSKNSLFIVDETMAIDKINTYDVSEGAQVSVNESSVAWSDNQGFLIRNFADPENPVTYKDGLPGEILGIHLTETHLFCLWREGEEVQLSKTGVDYDQGWEHIRDYSSDDTVHFASEEGRGLLLYEDNFNKSYSIVTLSSYGASGSLDLETIYKLRGEEPHRLLTPTDETSHYFAISYSWYNEPELTLLYPKKRAGRRLGRAEEKKIASLDDFQSSEFYDMSYSEGRGFLLGDQELILFDKEDVREIIPLPEDLHGAYRRVTCSKARVLLWSEGDDKYQEILLPKAP